MAISRAGRTSSKLHTSCQSQLRRPCTVDRALFWMSTCWFEYIRLHQADPLYLIGKIGKYGNGDTKDRDGPAGRPYGAKSRHTKARETALSKAFAKVDMLMPGAFEGDAHALLMLCYKNPDLPITVRLDAAKAALPYEKPRLVPAEVRPHEQEISLADRLKAYAREEEVEASGGKVVAMPKRDKPSSSTPVADPTG